MVLVPGGGASLLLHGRRPGNADLPLRVATALAAGYAVAALVAFALALGGWLTRPAFLVALAAASATLWAAALRRRSGHHRRLPDGHRMELVAGGGLMVAISVILLLRFDPVANLGSAGRWRYWADALEMADARRIPAHSFQWGMTVEATHSKVILNAFSAALSLVAGRDVIPAHGALLWLSVLGWGLALWALAWERGLRRTAALLPLVSPAALDVPVVGWVLHERAASNQAVYQAEDVGRMVATAAAALGVHAIRTRARPEAVVAAGVLGVAAATNLIPTLVMVLLVTCFAVALSLLERRAAPALWGVAVGGGAALATGVVWVLSPGTLGFGAGGASGYRAFRGLDPTALFDRTARAFDYAEGRSFYVPLGDLVRDFGVQATGLEMQWVVVAALFVAACLGAVWLARRLDGDLRAVPLASVALAGLLFCAAALFSHRGSLYIPATFGQRRLFEYADLPVLLYLSCLVELALSWLPRAAARRAAVAAIAVAAAMTLPWLKAPDQMVRQGRAVARVISDVNTHVPCAQMLLVNRRTNGLFQTLTGRVSVTEGGAPYLRPALLDQVLRRISAAGRFLRAPVADVGYLDPMGIGYVALLPGEAASSADRL